MQPGRQIEIIGEIQILEHGLEEPTINGVVVKNKWNASL